MKQTIILVKENENTHYPYIDLYDKVAAYKKDIISSLENAVHPDHLKRVYAKLDKLNEFWTKDLAPKG